MSSADLAAVPGLADFSTYMDASEQGLAGMLVANGQAALFKDWKLGADEAAKHAFFEQVRGLERGYPGGVAAYLKNARDLLRDSATDANPFEGYTPKVRSVGLCNRWSRFRSALFFCRSPWASNLIMNRKNLMKWKRWGRLFSRVRV